MHRYCHDQQRAEQMVGNDFPHEDRPHRSNGYVCGACKEAANRTDDFLSETDSDSESTQSASESESTSSESNYGSHHTSGLTNVTADSGIFHTTFAEWFDQNKNESSAAKARTFNIEMSGRGKTTLI